jgi:hypothetical protein
MLYEGYSLVERTNDILDKISKYGVRSLTVIEREFLDAYKGGTEKEVHDRIKFLENEKVFEDDYGYFKFEHTETEDYGDEVHYIGTLYAPDLEFPNEERIEGRLEGKIVVYSNGQISPDFFSIKRKPNQDVYDIFEFCNGLEYELDSFLDYVVAELNEKNEY